MQFRAGADEAFVGIFEQMRHKIESFPGCLSVSLWRDKNDPLVFFTLSDWRSEDDLEAYRKSDLFRETWTSVKMLFSAPASAWTLGEHCVSGGKIVHMP